VGVGVTNYSGAGAGVGRGVEANNFLGVDLGVYFLVSEFCVILFYTHTHRASPVKGAHGNLTGFEFKVNHNISYFFLEIVQKDEKKKNL
jgi:hypothetical protein